MSKLALLIYTSSAGNMTSSFKNVPVLAHDFLYYLCTTYALFNNFDAIGWMDPGQTVQHECGYKYLVKLTFSRRRSNHSPIRNHFKKRFFPFVLKVSSIRFLLY